MEDRHPVKKHVDFNEFYRIANKINKSLTKGELIYMQDLFYNKITPTYCLMQTFIPEKHKDAVAGIIDINMYLHYMFSNELKEMEQ